MLHSILLGITALLMAVLTPVALISPVEGEPVEHRLLMVEPPAQQPEPVREVQIQTGETVTSMALEAYLVGVVLSEMPMSFEMEALKAQAVAARTFAMGQMEGGKHEGFDLCGTSSCCQAWTSREKLEEKLGGEYWERASQAVEETAGLVLTYEGRLIDAVYFSCSGGTTEDAVAVWGGQVPYLRSVESPGEEDASKFTSTVSLTHEAFKALLPEADLTGELSTWLGDVTHTNGGGVAQMTIGGHSYSGTELRSRVGLNSTMFQLRLEPDEIVFEVRGYGHRVGMSQYGANAMAKEGKSFREILAHYYTGAILTKA